MTSTAHPNKNLGRGFRGLCIDVLHRFLTGGAVLAYHGVYDGSERVAGSMHVNIERFAATVRALRHVTTVVPLRELMTRQLRGESTKGLMAITFDDAYGSVLRLAEKVILAEQVPVTLFVVTSVARNGAPFWWDRVEQVFAAATPERWRAFEVFCGVPDAYRLGQAPSMGRLRPFRQWILAEHCGRWPAALEEPLAQLERELSCGPTQRPLTFEELDRLVANPLVDVGPHTVTHPVLPLLPDDEVRQEIRWSFDELRSRYPRTLPVLTPPFGLYDERTIRLGVEEGMQGCMTLEPTLLDDMAPGDTMPRIGMTRRHRPLQAALFAIGCWKGVRPDRLGHHRYPELPSEST
jgi:peptidoglycan/xylan/chitin deacetylase (PgdA/CDA1 family)